MPPRLSAFRSLPSTTLGQTSKSSVCSQCLSKLQKQQLSTTPQHANGQRDALFRWLNGPGAVFKTPLPGSTNYLNAYDQNGNLHRAPDRGASELEREKRKTREDKMNEDGEDGKSAEEEVSKAAQARNQEQPESEPLPKETEEDLMPFPLNNQFRSQSVLSEELREEIWKRVMLENQDVRTVSAALSVEMRRVGAVVRLKSLEKEWVEEGKTLAMPYAKAVMAMLPQTPYVPNAPVRHESINDLPVHSATTRQMFHPVSESRHFTRTDASKVFERNLLPAEDRIPHPELVQLDKWKFEGVEYEKRVKMQREVNEREVRARKLRQQKKLELERLTTKVAETPRWQFKFKEINAESVGKDGRDRRGVGARYGMPHEDRKRGIIKIPTRVD